MKKLFISALETVFVLVCVCQASAAPILIGLGGFSGGETVIDYGPPPPSNLPINGMLIDGVLHGFTISGSPSLDAVLDSGPGTTNNIAVTNIEGNAGGVLSLTFSGPQNRLGYGWAMSSAADGQQTTVELFDFGNTSLGAVSLVGTLDPTFMGGFLGVESIIAFTRAEVTWTGSASRFAFDNMRFEFIPEPSTLTLAALALLGILAHGHRRRGRYRAGTGGWPPVFSLSTCIRRTLMRLSIVSGLGVVIAACVCNSAFGGNPTLDGVPGDGVADLIVNVDNLNARIDTNGLPFSGFVLQSLGDHFNFPLPTTFDQDDPGLPSAAFVFSSADQASSQFYVPFFFPNGEITGVINLGQLYLTLPPNLNQDLDFTYTVNGVTGLFDGTLITVVPEPSTLTLAALSALCLLGLGRRRR